MLDPAGALHWPAVSLLAVSDLHLEKGSSYARHGQFLPPWDTHTTLDRLTLLLRRYRHAWWWLSATASTILTAPIASPPASSRASAP